MTDKEFWRHFILDQSFGRSKYGRVVCYMRPSVDCRNKSWRITGEDAADVLDKARKKAAKYFPYVIWLVDDHEIAAKDEQQARKEYGRICEKTKIGQPHKVELIG